MHRAGPCVRRRVRKVVCVGHFIRTEGARVLRMRSVLAVLALLVLVFCPLRATCDQVGVQEVNRCSKNNECRLCLETPSCGWCDGGGDADVCMYESQRDVLCANDADDFISRKPKGQKCPSSLYDGSTASPKLAMGFGEDPKNNPRREAEEFFPLDPNNPKKKTKAKKLVKKLLNLLSRL